MSDETTTEAAAADARQAPRLVRHGWNPPPAGPWAWLTARNVRRLLAMLAGVALLAWFGWLVWAPLRHPRVRFVCLSGADYRVLRAPPLAYAAEDVTGLAEHSSLFSDGGIQAAPYVWDNLAEPAKFQSLGARLNGIVDDERDQIVLYVSAHGLIDNGEAYLVCRNFDPANPRAGRVAAADLVKHLRNCRASRKVLVLDMGRIADDPRLGYVWNDLAARVADVVRASRDESIWLLTAHGAGEQSQVATAIERSVFGYALQWGLAGAADANGDDVVSLGELYHYAAATASDWVPYVTGGAAGQHPVLAWGSESPETSLDQAANDVVLAPVAPDFSAEEMPTLAEQVQAARANSRGEAWYLALNAENEAKRANENAAGKSGGNASLTAAKGAFTDSAKRFDFSHVRSAGQLRSQADTSAREAARQATGKAVEAQAEQLTSEKTAATTAESPTNPPTENPSPGAPANATDAAPTTTAPTTAPGDAAGDRNLAPAADPAAAARIALPKLFAEAWRLRDELNALPAAVRPSDYAPQSWREMEQALIDYELQYRAGRVGNTQRIRDGLNRMIAGQKRLLASVTDPSIGPAATGPTQMLRFRPFAARQITGAHSAALERLIAERAGRPANEAIERIVWAARIAPEDPAGFRTYWSTLSPETQQYSEARAAATFSAVAADQWPTARLAWEAANAAESLAAAAPWLVPWVGDELNEADAARWEGERELLDAIGGDHAVRARRLLEQSLAQYRAVASRLEIVVQARQLERDLFAKTPNYLRLAAAPRANANDATMAQEVFAAHCELLGRLSELLITPDAARVEELRDVSARLLELRVKLEAPFDSGQVAELASPPPKVGEPARIAALLDTAILPADARMRLLSIASRLEGRLVSDLKPVRNAKNFRAPLPDPAATARQVTGVAKLHWAMSRLSTLDHADGRQDEERVEAAYMELQKAAAEADRVADFAAQQDAFQMALSEFAAALPRRIAEIANANADLGPVSTRAERLVALRRAERALRLVDPRDARRTGDVAVCALIDAAEWQSLLSWQAARAAAAAGQATGADASYWSEIATRYHSQAAAVFGEDEDEDAGPPPLVLEGDDALDLTVEPERQATLKLRNRTAAPADVWLTLKYDPAVVTIETGGQYLWRLEHESPETSASESERDANLLISEPSLRINPGQEIPLRLQARSQGRAAQPARVVVRAVSRNARARHALTLYLPSTESIDLAIDGIPGTATRDDAGWLLTPFPNRDNAYTWTLAHGGAAVKEVKAELFALTRPWTGHVPRGSLSAAEAAELRERLGPLEPRGYIEKISLPGGQQPTLVPFPAPPADAAPPPPDQPPPSPPRFDHGLLLVLTDLADGRVSLHWIRSSPQRPRRYVRPRVRYNAIEERIEITITAENPAGMPDKPVRVACETLEPLPTGTQARLSDELRAPDYRAELWIQAPLDPARVVTLSLSVDDYPRAFLFRVPCQESGRDLAPEDDLMAIRVKSPVMDTAYKAPAASIDVVAEVDLPRAAEDDPTAEIELGFDTDRDREFRGEATKRLVGDRQVANQLAQLAPGGKVVVRPQVTDFHLSLAPPGLVNNRVGVLGRILWGDRAAWSEPREIVLDGAPPRIERVRVKPAGVAAIGSQVEVSCLALDGDLSGVASVEMTIDQQGTAEFEGNLPPTPAKLGADRRWTAQLDTTPIGAGTYRVLIRATDQVGNVSDVDSTGGVRLLSAETIAAERRRATNRVAGAVQYGRSGFGGITVTLEAVPPDPAEAAAAPPAPPPEPIPAVATDDQGSFLFERVPPGKYKLTAEGVVRNKVRRAEAEVTVEPAPTAVRPLRLELR